MAGMADKGSRHKESWRPTWYEIDLAAFRHNVQLLRSLIGDNVALYACLKRNAYGCGAGPIARAAMEGGADGLAIGNIDDALEVRRAGVSGPILLYPTCLPESAPAVVEYGLTPTVSTPAEVETWAAAFTRPHPVFAKFDIGLFRSGAQPSTLGELLTRIRASRKLELAGLYTHFHTYAGPEGHAYMEWQIGCLHESLKIAAQIDGLPPIVMAANSAVVSERPELDLSGVDPGRLLYGVGNVAARSRDATIRPVVVGLKTRLLLTKTIAETPPDVTHAPFPVRPGMRIGILPIGWGDGLPRRFLPSAFALIRGQPAPLLNPVHLEHLRIDLSSVPEAQPGDEVALIGSQGEHQIGLNEVQSSWGMDPLTFLAGMRDHIRRVYLDS